MFASMIFRKEPFFHGHDNYDQVGVIRIEIITLWGSNMIFNSLTFARSRGECCNERQNHF